MDLLLPSLPLSHLYSSTLRAGFLQWGQCHPSLKCWKFHCHCQHQGGFDCCQWMKGLHQQYFYLPFLEVPLTDSYLGCFIGCFPAFNELSLWCQVSFPSTHWPACLTNLWFHSPLSSLDCYCSSWFGLSYFNEVQLCPSWTPRYLLISLQLQEECGHWYHLRNCCLNDHLFLSS